MTKPLSKLTASCVGCMGRCVLDLLLRSRIMKVEVIRTVRTYRYETDSIPLPWSTKEGTDLYSIKMKTWIGRVRVLLIYRYLKRDKKIKGDMDHVLKYWETFDRLKMKYDIEILRPGLKYVNRKHYMRN